jgi:hypothetical protein
LKSKPIIIPISEGASLPINFYEYYDARTFIKMREKEKLSFFNRNIVGYFKEKYGMD